MGRLHDFDLQPWIEEYDIENFIETGVGKYGYGLFYAKKFKFKRILSTDIDKIHYKNALKMFKRDSRIQIHFDNSKDFLNNVLPIDGNILFWLDAHFPVYYQKGHFDKYVPLTEEYKNEIPKNIRLPLEDELRVIIEKQDISSSVFLIDDYRCYEPDSDDFENGKHPQKDVLGLDELDSNIFTELLGPTHDLVIDRRDSGYLIATPKKI